MKREISTDIIALKKIMVEKRLEKITDLSNATGISRNTLSGVLRGRIQPSADVMMRLAATLEITASQAGEIFFNDNLRIA